MTMLDRAHRRLLEQTARRARRAAETGAEQALEHLSVAHHEPRAHLTPEQRKLRNRLRARAKQLGDRRNAQGRQEVTRLVEQCAYEHWHRILFARFLAENEFLIEPTSGVAISLDDCRELAAEQQRPWIALASDYAVQMLPQVFRSDDPVLEVELPAERRAELETLLEELPLEVFAATDSLGWTYQFWQADAKELVNESEEKVGPAELGPVTQLFTEDYIVDFLLHNTIGAWWVGRAKPIVAATEDEARAKASLPARHDFPSVEWKSLRFIQDEDGRWVPAAGTYKEWPATAKMIRVLDPCMGSGHFLTFALPLLARLRSEEEQSQSAEAVSSVLRENLFGLELDERCTQIAAFNLALVAWRITGYRVLPSLNLACSGLNISATEHEWTALANGDVRLTGGMKRLYELFRQAPVLGSLVDPRSVSGEVFEAGFDELDPLLTRAVFRERGDENGHELAVTAHGVAKAAEILANAFTLVVTNVPYLGRGKQDEVLRQHCERVYPHAKSDLATCFIARCLDFCRNGGCAAIVSPQNWMFQGSYTKFRQHLLSHVELNLVLRLGEHAFDSPSAAGAFVVAFALTNRARRDDHHLIAMEAADERSAEEKASSIAARPLIRLQQARQLKNPDSRFSLVIHEKVERLSEYCDSYLGLGTGDYPHYGRCFWEFPHVGEGWTCQQGTVETMGEWGGREHLVAWDQTRNRVGGMSDAERSQIHNQDQSGQQAWTRRGVAVGLMRDLKPTLYTGEPHEKMLAALIPRSSDVLPALWAFCTDREFHDLVRQLDQNPVVANGTLVKVPFDLARWQKLAAERYPNGLPKPHSDDPTQWLFDGHPKSSSQPLQVAVARLLGYRWPRQTGSDFVDCASIDLDGLEPFIESDGVVCLPSLQREQPAATRLRSLLANAFGAEWNGAKERQLLAISGSKSDSIEHWLRDEFFVQHCELFHQRPLAWHVWDGRVDGFSALVSYHKLVQSDGEGRRTLDRLTHTYLGDWITRQRAAVSAREDGAETRLAAAEHLKAELELILHGEPPYDLFARWKPLYEQPLGWEPDINDGVRMNIRPFTTARPFNARGSKSSILRMTPKIKWDKDRGKEAERQKENYPWFWDWDGSSQDFAGNRAFDGVRWNDLHYSRSAKQAARDAHAMRAVAATR